MTAPTSLTLERVGRSAIVTFNTPDRLNAISEARLSELEWVLDTVETDAAIGALIFTGAGRAFCVGLDLDLLDRAFDDIPYFETVVRRLAAIIERIEALPIPTIAAVNGYARAGGFELTLGCDFCLIADEARIGDVHTDAGVVPACVTLRLRRRIGAQRAKELILSARWLDGAEAVAYGLALRAVPGADLRAEALRFAGTMTDKPAPVVRAMKAIFRDGEDLGVKEGTELELRSFATYMSTQPYGREGYRAFREHREPAWRARDAG